MPLARPVAAVLVSIAVLASSFAVAADAPIKGHLLIIGGGDRPASVMSAFARLAGGPSGKVLVFPQASELPDSGDRIKEELTALGIGVVEVIAAGRDEANSDAVLERAAGATSVYFGGGDQVRLVEAIGGTKLEALLRDLYRRGAVVAGTSAGAAVMSRVMITGDEKRPFSKDDNWQKLEADNVITRDGFGFLPEHVVVDQHFVIRKRYGRLLSLVMERPTLLGVAIDESTAVLVKPDRTFEVIGDGPVLVLNAAGAKVARQPDSALRASGLTIDVLRAGSTYDLQRREVITLAP
jgi:cyanophycinase